VFKLLEDIGTHLITKIFLFIVTGIIGLLGIKKIKINKLLPIFFPEIKKKLEDIISVDEIDENDEVIECFREKCIIKRKIVKELLIQNVRYANSKGKRKEINAVTLLSLILPIEDSFNILKVFIEDEHIDMRISKVAVYKLKNILLREGLANEDREKIRHLLVNELNRERHKINAIECLKHIPDEETLIKLLPYIIDCKAEYKVCKVAISSIEAICDKIKEFVSDIFYHYAELVSLVSENQKIVNSIIVILKSQKNRRAQILIDKIIDRGRFSEIGEKSDWIETREILTKTGD